MVGDKSRIRGRIRASYKSRIFIGNGTTSTTFIQVFAAEQTDIILGDDAMLAAGVIIRSEDGHAIYDVISGKRHNYSKNVTIGAHVWLAEDVIVLTGAQIGSGSIVGAR